MKTEDIIYQMQELQGIVHALHWVQKLKIEVSCLFIHPNCAFEISTLYEKLNMVYLSVNILLTFTTKSLQRQVERTKHNRVEPAKSVVWMNMGNRYMKGIRG